MSLLVTSKKFKLDEIEQMECESLVVTRSRLRSTEVGSIIRE